MTNPSSPTSSRSTIHRSWAQKIVLQQLGQLSQGKMVVQLPQGESVILGNKTSAEMAAQMTIHDENFFQRVVLAADIGLCESYMAGEWDSPDLTSVIAFFIKNIEQTPGMSGSARRTIALGIFRLGNRLGHLLRPNTKKTVRINIAEHYDVSNDFFQLFLDPSMMYSSARWDGCTTLAQAQWTKNQALARHLQLKSTDHLLEIGSGWGGFALHAVREFGCRVTTLTISQAQYELAQKRIQEAGLSEKITVKLEDFRDHQGCYDKCVSIEMMEALGHRYLPDFCRGVSRLLKPQGIAAFQYITCPDSRYEAFRRGVDFIQKHIFPGSLLLSINRVNQEMTKAGNFQCHRLEEFGLDYAKTLAAWAESFEKNLPAIKALGFNEVFIRKWRLYFRYCEAAFAQRNIGVVQAVYVRPNNLECI